MNEKIQEIIELSKIKEKLEQEGEQCSIIEKVIERNEKELQQGDTELWDWIYTKYVDDQIKLWNIKSLDADLDNLNEIEDVLKTSFKVFSKELNLGRYSAPTHVAEKLYNMWLAKMKENKEYLLKYSDDNE